MRSFILQFAVLASLAAIPAAIHSQTANGSVAPVDDAKPTDASTDTNAVATSNSHKKADKKKSKKELDAQEKRTVFKTKIRDGVLNLDGMVGKIHLDYDLDNERFLYFYVPGEGTAVVARAEMPGAKKIGKAFDGKKLTFSTGGHDFSLESRDLILGKGTDDAYVCFDNSAQATTMGKYPMMGYGKVLVAPYTWPAAAASEEASDATGTNAPRVPAYMLPKRTNPSAASAPAPAAAATPAAPAPVTDNK